MPFGKTHTEILEMMQDWAFYVPNAREICRRAGVFPPRSSIHFAAHTYVGNPDNIPEDTIYSDAFQWEIPEEGGSGFWHWPGGRAKMANRVDLTSCSEMRLCVHNRFPTSPARQLYPIFTPEPSWDEINDSTSGWLLADGTEVPSLPPAYELADLPAVEPRMDLNATGAYFTPWVPIPEVTRQDVFIHFAVTGETADVYEIGYAQLQVRG